MNPLETGMEKNIGETCQVCRRKSDVARELHGWTLCGGHYDAAQKYLNSWREGKSYRGSDKSAIDAWVTAQRDGPFRRCWEVEG